MPWPIALTGIAALLASCAGMRSSSEVAPAAVAHGSIVDAARHQDWAAVQAMARAAGTDLAATSTEGSTALHFAIDAGENAAVRGLLGAGADVSVRNLAGVPYGG